MERIARRSYGFAVPALRLRPLRFADEEPFVAAHRELAAEGFRFGLSFEPGTSWSAYLRLVEERRAGTKLPDGFVPATFLVAEVGGEIVGRASIRHELNAFLAREGGHIGYCVLRDHRRRGYATEILRQSLVVARAVGVDDVLVTCDDDNVASTTVIEKCGGQLDSVVQCESGAPLRRYWIT